MLTGFVEELEVRKVGLSFLVSRKHPSPMSTFQVPESPQAPGAACET